MMRVFVGGMVGTAFAVVTALAVFVAAVGWDGNVSDWYMIPTVLWGLICGGIGTLSGGKRV
jgi:hypothetical protein